MGPGSEIPTAMMCGYRGNPCPAPPPGAGHQMGAEPVETSVKQSRTDIDCHSGRLGALQVHRVAATAQCAAQVPPQESHRGRVYAGPTSLYD